MGVTSTGETRTGATRTEGGVPAAVVWHDLECGLYRADLPLWRELAEEARVETPKARILDVGAGTGRVALDLARAGHAVTALDLDPALLGALGERAADAGVEVERVCADARSFTLGDGGFGLCVAPMQTLQLLEGSAGRVAFFEQARAHLAAGALLACAIVTEVEPFDCSTGDSGPSPEVVRTDGVEYVSRAVRVRVNRSVIRIERERRSHRIDESAVAPRPTRAFDAPETERDVIELDRVGVAALRREGRRAGLSHVEVREIPATAEHVGSEVVILRV